MVKGNYSQGFYSCLVDFDMSEFHISFMEQSDIREAAQVLSLAMLNNPLHIAVFRGNGENERLELETMFTELFNTLPGIIFLARERRKIIGVMRMKSCTGREDIEKVNTPQDEDSIGWRKAVWLREWAAHEPREQHWHFGPIGVLPAYRKMGVGSSLMQRFCDEVDACSATAYLETDLDENVHFYRKFGFEVVSRSMVFAIESRYMERKARK